MKKEALKGSKISEKRGRNKMLTEIAKSARK